MVKIRYALLCEEFENEKKNKQKKIDLSEEGFEPQIFINQQKQNLPGESLRSHFSVKFQITTIVLH